MKAIEWLEKTYDVENSEYPVRPFAWCKDGYGVSIQGGDSAKYCTPRYKCNSYEEVELGFPTTGDVVINEYAETPGQYTQTVYGYVPIEVVEELVEKHGGIDFYLSIQKHVDACKTQKRISPYEKCRGL